jgi:hypothetical protein
MLPAFALGVSAGNNALKCRINDESKPTRALMVKVHVAALKLAATALI